MSWAGGGHGGLLQRLPPLPSRGLSAEGLAGAAPSGLTSQVGSADTGPWTVTGQNFLL